MKEEEKRMKGTKEGKERKMEARFGVSALSFVFIKVCETHPPHHTLMFIIIIS